MSARCRLKAVAKNQTVPMAGHPQGRMSFLTFSGDCLRAVGKVPAGRMWVFRNFPRGARYCRSGEGFLGLPSAGKVPAGRVSVFRTFPQGEGARRADEGLFDSS